MNSRTSKSSQLFSQRSKSPNKGKQGKDHDDTSLFLQCPICGLNIIKSLIEEHVEKCLTDQQDNSFDSNKSTHTNKKEDHSKGKVSSQTFQQPQRLSSLSYSEKSSNHKNNNISLSMKEDVTQNSSSLDNSINPLTTTKPTVNSNSFVSSNPTTNSSSTPSQQPISSSNQTSLYQRTPLAERSRPNQFDNLAGNSELFQQGSIVRTLLEKDPPPSLILTGPPGCGKTTIARIIINQSKCPCCSFSCCTASISEIRVVAEKAEKDFRSTGFPSILFLDEIHRFNRKQQDFFLPFVEKGVIVLIGATTENPSFSINEALLSRCRIIVLKGLSQDDLCSCLSKAIETDPIIKSSGVIIDKEAIQRIAERVDGDARKALNIMEACINSVQLTDNKRVTPEIVQQNTRERFVKYDKHDEQHYNIISALHKSIRGSDVQASLYYLGRMLEGGENPLYIVRRLIRASTEDIGLADPYALILATQCHAICKELGSPLCNTALSQCVAYLAMAPKSNELYIAFNKIASLIHESGCLAVPLETEQQHSLLPVDLQNEMMINVHRAISDLREPSLKRYLEGKNDTEEKEKDANLSELPLEKRSKLYLHKEENQ